MQVDIRIDLKLRRSVIDLSFCDLKSQQLSYDEPVSCIVHVSVVHMRS